MTNLQMSLLENAFDFLEEGADRLLQQEQTPRSLKYAVLHLSSGVELLLKQRLYNEHWSLIFSDINKADLKLLKSGDFTSINFNDARIRLEKISEIRLDERHKKTLDALKRERNKIEHYQVSLNRTTVISIVIQGWSFVTDFVFDHLQLDAEQQNRFTQIRRKIIPLRDFVSHRIQEISADLDKLGKNDTAVVRCPECLQDALPITGEDTECLFCRQPFNGRVLEKTWLDMFAWWHESWVRGKDIVHETLLQECPNCGLESFYQMGEDSADPIEHTGLQWICFNCGHHIDYSVFMDTCMVCGRSYPDESDEPIGICESCVRAQMDD